MSVTALTCSPRTSPDAVLDALTCLPFYEELTDYLPARRLDRLTDELAAQASFVRHLIAANTQKEER